MAPRTRQQKNAAPMGPVVPSTNTDTPARPVSSKEKKNKEMNQPTVTLPRQTIKIPPLVGAAAAATGSASVTLGKRVLSPEDGHEQGHATSGQTAKKRHVKDDEEDASHGDVQSVRKLKRTETLVVVNSAGANNSSTDSDTDHSSDEECALTPAVVQKMALEASDTMGSDQGNTHGGTPKGPNGYSPDDYLQAGCSQANYMQAQEDYSLAGYSQAQEDYSYSPAQEDYSHVGNSQEDDWQAGYSQEDYSQVGSYTLFEPEAAGAASEDNGATRAHFEATLVHSEATPVHSKAMYPRSEVMHSRSEVIHGRSKAVHGRPEVTHSRSEAIHGRSEATHSRSEVTHSYSGAVHAEATHAHSEVTPDRSKAMRTCSKAAHTHSKTTPSHREGYQGTHSGSAASNGHHATPAHANNRQVSGPIGGWPDETNLRSAVSGKPRLTEQTRFMRDIIKASFPHLRASIMIHDAYPDATLIGTFVLRAFLAATSNDSRAVYVHQRIRQDHVYLSKMTVLPRARITVFRAEVKERCVAAVALLINLNDSPTSIADLIDKQLNDNYNYIFPRRSNSLNILSAPPSRRLPYRSNIITSVIRDLFFTGPVPFATQHRELFPTHPGVNGTVAYEIPKSMLTLVSTAYYAALHEWSSGKRQQQNFTADGSADVYRSHLTSLNSIETEHKSSYHIMMMDIYQLAASSIGQTAIPVPSLDISTLEMDK
ncbi:hypothetical protein EDB83DRAFT_2320999 [Lactarius deliciosus]|nr:hypothetical protein EDB83DRAFT_2320999 [Lactarius deliciosus]